MILPLRGKFQTGILISIAILCFLRLPAQTSITLKGDTLILEGGQKFWIGEEMTLGNGSAADNSFMYVYESPNSIKNIFNKNKKPPPIPSMYDGHTCMVKKFEKDATYKNTYSYNILVLQFVDGKTYWCDIDNALKTKEIVSKQLLSSPTPVTDSHKQNSDSHKKSDPTKAPNVF
jgi:hypothetical protein